MECDIKLLVAVLVSPLACWGVWKAYIGIRVWAVKTVKEIARQTVYDALESDGSGSLYGRGLFALLGGGRSIKGRVEELITENMKYHLERFAHKEKRKEPIDKTATEVMMRRRK